MNLWKRRILPMLLSCCMLIGLLPAMAVTVAAADEQATESAAGTAVFDFCDGTEPVAVEESDGVIEAPSAEDCWGDDDSADDENYTMEGWYTEPNGWGEAVTSFTAGETYYAHWLWTLDKTKTLYTTTFDFTGDEMRGHETGDGYAWDPDTNTLTLEGLDLYASRSDHGMVLPADSTIYVRRDQQYSIICGNWFYTPSEAIAWDIVAMGDLTVKGEDAEDALNLYTSYGGLMVNGALYVSENVLLAASRVSVKGDITVDKDAILWAAPYDVEVPLHGSLCSVTGDININSASAAADRIVAAKDVNIVDGFTHSDYLIKAGGTLTDDLSEEPDLNYGIYISEGSIVKAGCEFADWGDQAVGPIGLNAGNICISSSSVQTFTIAAYNKLSILEETHNTQINVLPHQINEEKLVGGHVYGKEIDIAGGILDVQTADVGILAGTGMTIRCAETADGIKYPKVTVKPSEYATEKVTALFIPSINSRNKLVLDGVDVLTEGSVQRIPAEKDNIAYLTVAVDGVPVERVTIGQPCPFTDVTHDDWYWTSVNYVYSAGLMNGVSSSRFDPEGEASRAMAATILWRIAGECESTAGKVFPDVPDDTWYRDAVAWVSENGIVDGYPDGSFRPDDAVTREQFALMLYRLCALWDYDTSIGEETNILSFDDAFEISEYARQAMQWAIGAGIMEGKDNNLLDPQGTTTRAELATMVMRFLEQVG